MASSASRAGKPCSLCALLGLGEKRAPSKASPAIQGLPLGAQAAGLRQDVRVVHSQQQSPAAPPPGSGPAAGGPSGRVQQTGGRRPQLFETRLLSFASLRLREARARPASRSGRRAPRRDPSRASRLAGWRAGVHGPLSSPPPAPPLPLPARLRPHWPSGPGADGGGWTPSLPTSRAHVYAPPPRGPRGPSGVSLARGRGPLELPGDPGAGAGAGSWDTSERRALQLARRVYLKLGSRRPASRLFM